MQTCGHRFREKDFSSPESEQRRDWRTRHQTEPRRRARFRGAYLLGLLAFVLFSFCSTHSCRRLFSCKGHWRFTNTLFISGVKKKNQQHKGIQPWECWGEKRTNASIKKKKEKKKCNTLQRMNISCATFRTLGLNSLVLFHRLCSVFMLISLTIWSLYVLCWLYIFFLYIKKKRKKDIIAHYLAHTWKSGSCLRKARVPEYRLHAILMYIFMMSKKKKKGWFKRNNSKHWKLWISEEEKIPFVSKSVAVT